MSCTFSNSVAQRYGPPTNPSARSIPDIGFFSAAAIILCGTQHGSCRSLRTGSLLIIGCWARDKKIIASRIGPGSTGSAGIGRMEGGYLLATLLCLFILKCTRKTSSGDCMCRSSALSTASSIQCLSFLNAPPPTLVKKTFTLAPRDRARMAATVSVASYCASNTARAKGSQSAFFDWNGSYATGSAEHSTCVTRWLGFRRSSASLLWRMHVDSVLHCTPTLVLLVISSRSGSPSASSSWFIRSANSAKASSLIGTR
mmetsp:Transcript_45775/g.108535  ORF Transcript_45775/g.108535 Transcript_45775/m.108535 type:complete len:257 (+) Transcript_45775:429-1199(+)